MNKKYVACALLVRDGKLLIQERKGISKYGEHWSFFGGKIEDGENSRKGLLREIQEELELDISSWDIRYLGEIVHFIKDFDIEYHRVLFLIQIPSDINNFDDKEGSGAYFYDFDELSSLKFNTSIKAEIELLKENC